MMKTIYWIIIISVLLLINISTIAYYEVDKKLNEELIGYSSKFYYDIQIINDEEMDYSILMPIPVYNASRDRKYIPDFMEEFKSENGSTELDFGYPQNPRSHVPYFRISGDISDRVWVFDESKEIEPDGGKDGFIAEHFFNEIIPIGDNYLYMFNNSFPIFNENNETNVFVQVELSYHLSNDIYNGFHECISSSGTKFIITGSGELKHQGWNYINVNVQVIAFD